MSATRVIDDHKELENIGNVPHVDIDTHISSSQFLVLSSSTNTPPSARHLNLTSGLTGSDSGPGSDFTISLNIAAGPGVTLSTSSNVVTISATGGSGTLPLPTDICQTLFAVDGVFVPSTPITHLNVGWLMNDLGYLLVK